MGGKKAWATQDMEKRSIVVVYKAPCFRDYAYADAELNGDVKKEFVRKGRNLEEQYLAKSYSPCVKECKQKMEIQTWRKP